MNIKPHVGQRVRLNDFGLEQVGGLRSAEAIRQAQSMIITHVDAESLTHPEPTWAIEVDQPEINFFLLDHTMVDQV